MRAATIDEARRASADDLLTTGEAARLLGTSRQHVVNLCERGLLPHTTTGRHRRIRRGDLEASAERSRRLSRDERRSLWLNVAVAGALVTDPDRVLRAGRDNLETMRAAHPRGQVAHWLDEWEELLGGPVEDVVSALVAATPRSRELRQNSPFAGVLAVDERAKVLDAFRRARSGR